MLRKYLHYVILEKRERVSVFSIFFVCRNTGFSETCICIVSLQSYSGQNYKFNSDAVTIIRKQAFLNAV